MLFSRSAGASVDAIRAEQILDKSCRGVHILLGGMLKRFATILFVLTLAGNVWAGICDCFEGSGHSESKCCKRDRSGRTAVSTEPCCGDECGQSDFVNVHRTQADSQVRIPLPADVISVDLFQFLDTGRIASENLKRYRPDREFRPHFPRPPNLYIKHSSFLI